MSSRRGHSFPSSLRQYSLPDLRRFGILSAHMTISAIVKGLGLLRSASRRRKISTAVRHSPEFNILSMWFVRFGMMPTQRGIAMLSSPETPANRKH